LIADFAPPIISLEKYINVQEISHNDNKYNFSGIPRRNNFTLLPSKQAKKFGGTSITLVLFLLFSIII